MDAPLSKYLLMAACLTERAYPARKESLGIGLFARGGKAQLRSMEVWPMTPIFPDRMKS